MADTLQIPLTNGGFTLIDALDWESSGATGACGKIITARPCDQRWNGQVRSSGTYARCSIRGVTVYLHRLIMSAPAGVKVDHRNLDELDNRRENLRFGTQKQNCGNRLKHRCSPWQHKGIRFHRGGWEVQVAGRYVGRFTGEAEAARAYDAAAIEEYGEFALLNFPNDARKLNRDDAFSKLGK